MRPVPESELSGREYGFILPDGSRLVGDAGGRHDALAKKYFADYWDALRAGWVSYSMGSKHLNVHVWGTMPGARFNAARLIHEANRMENAVGVHWPDGRHDEQYFGHDERAAERFIRSAT